MPHLWPASPSAVAIDEFTPSKTSVSFFISTSHSRQDDHPRSLAVPLLVMDLLQSLILPHTGGVQAQSSAQLLQQAIDAATPEVKQQLLRSLAVLCNAIGSSIGATPARQIFGNPSVSTPKAAIPQLCGFWYHYGDCRCDPSSPTYDGSKKLCPYLHHIEPGMEDVMCQKLPRTIHRAQCELSRCPLSTRPRLSGKQARLQSPIRLRCGRDAQSVVGAEMRGQKRVRSEVENRDRREDVLVEPRSKNVATSAETCFFWSVISHRLAESFED